MTPLLLAALLAAAPPLTTVAELSGWTKTGRYEEVERLCAAFPKAYPRQVKCERFGVTPLGRPMFALIASADGVFTPQQARAKRRPVVLAQGGIHAGEIDGKDAGFWFLREALDGKAAPGALKAVTFVFVPVFNVDGFERFGPNQRPNQVGPEETGWRVTSQNLNLNRDYAKADAPEMRAMLQLLHRYEPIMYVDLHVTDGAKFQHDVAVCMEPMRLGSPTQQAQGRALRDALLAKLAAQGHLPLDFYPAFEDSDDPGSGFSAGWPPPRFGNAYWAANHRFGVLVETHSWKPSAVRIKATFDVLAGLLERAAVEGKAWQEAAEAADAAALTLGGTDVVLMHAPKKQGRAFAFQGYAYTRTPSEVSGKPWVRYDDTKPQVWTVQLRDVLEPSLTLRAPTGGYVVPAPYAAPIAARLQAHGVRFEVLKAPKPGLDVERMRVEHRYKAYSVEGRAAVELKGTWQAGLEDLTPGALFVPIRQAKAELVMHLFEPAAPDSFAAWGFFNAHLEQKEYLEDYLAEAYARELLGDVKVKAEFDEKLKDAGFAKDADARLAFFARRHPSWDARMGLLPVYRVAAAP
jgi:hypothetical protein